MTCIYCCLLWSLECDNHLFNLTVRCCSIVAVVPLFDSNSTHLFDSLTLQLFDSSTLQLFDSLTVPSTVQLLDCSFCLINCSTDWLFDCYINCSFWLFACSIAWLLDRNNSNIHSVVCECCGLANFCCVWWGEDDLWWRGQGMQNLGPYCWLICRSLPFWARKIYRRGM